MAAETLIAEARQAVTDYLAEHGITVLDQDWNSPDDPIPIVAEEQNVLVFV